MLHDFLTGTVLGAVVTLAVVFFRRTEAAAETVAADGDEDWLDDDEDANEDG